MIEGLTIFDAIVAVFASVSVIMGFLRGLVRELSTLGAFIVAIAAALLAQPYLAAGLKQFFPENAPIWLPGASTFIVVFLIVNIMIVWLGGKLSGIVRRIVGIDFLDSVGGGLFGLMRSAVILVFCVWLTGLVIDREDLPEFIRDSVSYPAMEEAAQALTEYFPTLVMQEKLQLNASGNENR